MLCTTNSIITWYRRILAKKLLCTTISWLWDIKDKQRHPKVKDCYTFQVLRPFLLRRLKDDVEKQMPKKYEHIVMCHLSKRQRFLYDEFMAQGK